jgi:hypothetical protein
MTNPSRSRPLFFWSRLLLLIATVIMLLWSLNQRIDGAEFFPSDTRNNVELAYRLYTGEGFSLSTRASASHLAVYGEDQLHIQPTNFREPFPPMITALYLWAIGFERDHAIDDLYTGELAVQIKRVNLLLALLAMIGIWVVTQQLTGSFWLALIAILTSTAFFIEYQVNNLFTELPAAVLLTAAALFWIQGVRRGGPLFFALTGLAIGALCLTKAIFLYIAPVAIALLAGYQLLSGAWAPRRMLGYSLLMAAGLAVVILPWMIRNYHQLGRFEITQRSGDVLLTRAYKSQMNATEFRGAFYYWAPGALHEEIGALLGYTPQDLQPGGQLVRLNRRLYEDESFRMIPTLYQNHRSTMRSLIESYTEQGAENPSQLADQEAQSKAIEMVMSDPIAYLRATIPFVWRGMWSFGGVAWGWTTAVPVPGEGFDFGSLPWRISITLLNGLAYLSLLALPVLALRWRRADLLSFALLPLGMIAFYALLTHNLPRYNSPAIPAMLVAFLILAHRAGDNLAARLPQVRRVPRLAWGVLLLLVLYPLIIPMLRPVYVQLSPLPVKWLAQAAPVDLGPILFYERIGYQYRIERELRDYEGLIFSPLTGEAQRADIFVLSGSATVQERLDAQQRAAVEQWRQSYQPEILQQAGIEYVLVSREWAETLADGELASDDHPLQDQAGYQLLGRWESSPLKTWHELYRILGSP